MFKLIALSGLGASLHFLLLVNNLSAFHLTHLSEKELLDKLTTKDPKDGGRVVALDPEVVFKYIDHVRQKAAIKIGATNLKELHRLNMVELWDCLDDSLQYRLDVCFAAKEANLPNIDTYCQSRIDKMAQFCAKEAESSMTGALMVVDPETTEFFRKLMTNHFEDGPDQYKSVIKEYLNKFDPEAVQLRKHCEILTEDLHNLEAVLDYAKGHNSGKPIKMSSKVAGWTNVYQLCKYFSNNWQNSQTQPAE